MGFNGFEVKVNSFATTFEKIGAMDMILFWGFGLLLFAIVIFFVLRNLIENKNENEEVDNPIILPMIIDKLNEEGRRKNWTTLKTGFQRILSKLPKRKTRNKK